MAHSGSVTGWLVQLKSGDRQVSQQLWERYVHRLVRLARKKLGRTPRRAADEEDVVISVFDGFVRGVEERRFPRLDDRDDLWRVLVMLTDRKAVNQQRHELAKKRGGGRVRGDSALVKRGRSVSDQSGVVQLTDNQPTPEFAAECSEQIALLMASLDGDLLRRIAIYKMEGYTNEELARKLNTSPRTIERKLRLIRQTWEEKDTL